MLDQDHNDLSLCDLIMNGLDLITNTCLIMSEVWKCNKVINKYL